MTFTEKRFLLSERNNPHSSVRANGVRFWGYPERNGEIRCIVVHTTENEPGPSTAENVARWQASTAPAPSSYHVLVDSDSIVRTLEDEAVAFHCVGLNTRGLGLSFGTRHDRWGRYPAWDASALERGAWVAARWCQRYGIPVRWITKAEAERGERGFIRHSVADPARRRDPGGSFPHEEFFRLVDHYLKGEAVAPAATEEHPVIQQGDEGNDVRAIQRSVAAWLIARGGDPEATEVNGVRVPNEDGVYGPFTTKAVAEYQRRSHLERRDGIEPGVADALTAAFLLAYDPHRA